MISAARILGLAVAAAALLGVETMSAPANAQPACKDERIRAKSEIRAFRNAENEAKKNWEKAAQERFGEKFSKWANAKDANVECESARSPTLGLRAKVCTATGRPCSGGDTAVIEDLEPNRLTRGRDGRRRVTEWPRSGDPRHDREMVFQNRLAAYRERAEMRAYEREMAYQRRLAKARDRYRY
jgi:hypothetical protein